MSREHAVLGVDIGGSSIKCCLLNAQGILRHATLPYTNGKHPDAVLSMVNEIVESWNHDGPIGIGFPELLMEITSLMHRTWAKDGTDVRSQIDFICV